MRDILDILRDIAAVCVEAKEHLKTNRSYAPGEATPFKQLRSLVDEIGEGGVVEKIEIVTVSPKRAKPVKKAAKKRAPKP